MKNEDVFSVEFIIMTLFWAPKTHCSFRLDFKAHKKDTEMMLKGTMVTLAFPAWLPDRYFGAKPTDGLMPMDDFCA